MTSSELSALAIVTACVLYLLAFMAHTAEWAAARGVEVGRDDPAQRPAKLAIESWGRIGLALALVGFAAHLLGVVLRGVAAQRPPWGNMYEFTITSMLVIAVVYLALALRWGMRWLGLLVTLVLSVGLGLAATVFYVAVADLVPALHSVWFVVHIAAATISGGTFTVAGLASILFLLRSRAESRGEVTKGYLAKVPTARRLDDFCYRAHAFAFPIWTFTIAAGSIWGEYAWGRYWGWDPKETWSLVTWVVYACYLHARATAGWRGRPAAIIAIIGMVSFWFNFIGVNLIFNGLHSYAGI